MTLVIETGSGGATAQAYAGATAYAAWALLVYGETVTATTADQEAAILRAVRFMDGLSWYGQQTFGRAQGLAWPRAYVTDKDGWSVGSTEIPPEVIEAQHLFTRAELATPGSLAPSVTLAGGKTLIAVGSLQWKANAAPNTVDASRPVITAAMDVLSGLIRSRATSYVERA